jgi:hypothetical protein
VKRGWSGDPLAPLPAGSASGPTQTRALIEYVLRMSLGIVVGPLGRRSRRRDLAFLAAVAGVAVLSSPAVAIAGLRPFGSAVVACSPSDPTTQGLATFSTSPVRSRHDNVLVKITTAGAPGEITLDDGSAASFGADDTTWLAYGYQVSNGSAPEGSVDCSAGPLTAIVDYFDVPTVPAAFSGRSTGPCTVADFNTSMKPISACSDVTFDLPYSTYYEVVLALQSGSVTLHLPYQGGQLQHTFTHSSVWNLGPLDVGQIGVITANLLVDPDSTVQTRWNLEVRPTTRACAGEGFHAPLPFTDFAVRAAPNVGCGVATRLMRVLLLGSGSCSTERHGAHLRCRLNGFRCSGVVAGRAPATLTGSCLKGQEVATGSVLKLGYRACRGSFNTDGSPGGYFQGTPTGFYRGIQEQGTTCSQAVTVTRGYVDDLRAVAGSLDNKRVRVAGYICVTKSTTTADDITCASSGERTVKFFGAP